jgi:hypothetical protein
MLRRIALNVEYVLAIFGTTTPFFHHFPSGRFSYIHTLSPLYGKLCTCIHGIGSIHGKLPTYIVHTTSMCQNL